MPMHWRSCTSTIVSADLKVLTRMRRGAAEFDMRAVGSATGRPGVELGDMRAALETMPGAALT